MVTKTKPFKPDWAKVNPYEDAPEEYFERIRGTQAYKTAVERGWITDVPKVEELPPPEPIIPEAPQVITPTNVVDATPFQVNLLKQYKLEGTLSQKQLTAPLRLTVQDAKELGYDVAEGQPDFILQPTTPSEGELYGKIPQPIPTIEPDLAQFLKGIYPERFAQGQLPDVVLNQVYTSIEQDYQGFVNQLYERIGEDETARFLKTLGVSEEYVLGALSYEKQNERITNTIQSVFPDYEIKDLAVRLDTDFEGFIQDIQTDTGISWTDKRTLLEQIGFEPTEINEILRYRKTVLPVDGIRQLLTVDIETRAAYDENGDYMGKYNWATREFSKAPDKNIFQNFWDTLSFSSRQYWEMGESFLIGVLPELIYPEMPKGYLGGLGEFMNETNRQQRENWRYTYSQNKVEYDKWLQKNPEIAPKKVYQEGAFKNPELLKDPNYWAYEITNMMPFILSALAISAATGGVGLPFFLISTAGMGAVEGGAVYEDLINAGAPRDKAAGLSLVAGVIIGSLESVGRIPLLKQVSPALFGLFKRKAASELAKQGLAQTILKFGRNFTVAQFSEVSTEVAQEVVGNVAVSFFDENRSAFANIGDIAVKTAVAVAPMALFGAGVSSVRMVSPSELSGLSDIAKKAEGWMKDAKTNKWYEVLKGERGAIGGVLPSAEWSKMSVPDRVKIAQEAGLEGKVGSKTWETLTQQEKQVISSKILTPEVPAVPVTPVTLEVTIPKVEQIAGMPEAGYQPAMFEEVIDREVRPRGKGELVQISMDDQLKLEQARKAAEEAPSETQVAYEAQAQIEGLKVTHELDPVAQAKFKLGGRNVDLTAFISIREQNFPDYFTLKQAKIISPEHAFAEYTQLGTPKYNHIPRDVVLDDLSKKWNMTPDEIADRVMAIRQENRQIKEAQDIIKTQMTERPLPTVPELTTEEVAENWATIGQPKYTLKQAQALAGFFGEYVMSENAVTAYELQRELWSKTMAERSQDFKARIQELVVQGVSIEEAFNQAKGETLAGKLPIVSTDYFEGMTNDLRASLFTIVFHNKELQRYPLEMVDTLTALTNAIGDSEHKAKPIPRKRGTGSVLFPQGGSAWDRLNFVFGKQPRVLKAIEKMADEGKSLKDITEGVFHETGRAPIPIDQEMADYLRKLSDIPQGFKTLLEPPFDNPRVTDLRTPADLEFAKAELELGQQFADGKLTFDEFQLKRTEARDKAYPPIPVTRFEAPIEDAFKQPLLTTLNLPEKKMIVRVLKELGMSPIDIGNFIRANLASFDFSAFRQQKLLSAGHPIALYRGVIEGWKAMLSQKSAEANWLWITRRPLYQYYEEGVARGKDFLRPLVLAKGTAQYKGVEEYGFITGERLIPRLTGKIPWVKISARSFVSFTNTMNWLIYENAYKATLRRAEMIGSGQITLKAGEALDIQAEMDGYASYLADATQRASLGRMAPAAPLLNAFFFATRSRLGRLIVPRHLFSANPRVRAMAWKDIGLFVTTVGGFVMLGYYLGLWDVERDPVSAEVMSIRIGNLRIDPWSGYRQYAVLYSRMLSALFGKGKGKSSVTGAEYELNPLNLLEGFIRSSLAPLTSFTWDFLEGRIYPGGEKFDIANPRQWADRITPFAIQNIWEAFEEGWKEGAISILPSWVGEGVSVYTGDWVENWTKLGLPKYLENTAYGLTEPKYLTDDWWSDTAKQFKGVDPTTLTAAKGFSPQIRALAEALVVSEHLSTLPSGRLVSLNTDPSLDEPTFGEYYQMWKDREKLVLAGDKAVLTRSELQPDGKYKEVTYKGEDALTAFDADKKDNPTKNANLGNFSQRQFALLNEYWSITDKKKQVEFLKQHKDEIGINPRQDYLRTHPKENAQLAVWGQAKILTKEAYNQFLGLVKTLDIPDSAIPPLTLPPETSIDTHFTYEEMVTEGTHGNVQAKLLLLTDYLKAHPTGQIKEGEPQSYTEWEKLTIPDESLEYYQMRVDNANLDDQYDALTTDAERTQFKLDNPKWVDDTRRIDAMGKGSRVTPTSPAIVDAWVDRGHTIDEFGANSIEAQVWLLDNPDAYDWAIDNGLLTDRKAELLERENILRIDVQLRGLDPNSTEYQNLSLKKDAYTKGFGEDQIDNYVVYYNLDTKGFKRERMLLQDLPFAQVMSSLDGVKIPSPLDIPNVEYDNLYDEWKDEFDEYATATPERVEAMKFITADSDYFGIKFYGTKRATGFYLAMITRDAHYALKGMQDDPNYQTYVNTYAQWFKLQNEGKPENWEDKTKTDKWYEDDWFMMENLDFYENVYKGVLGNQRKDFRKVPTRDVFSQYLQYLKVGEGTPRVNYRWSLWNNGQTDFEEWLIDAGVVTEHIKDKKRREELTPLEKAKEEIYKQQAEWDKQLDEIEKILAGMK